jgi:ribosome biogenesis GTPase
MSRIRESENNSEKPGGWGMPPGEEEAALCKAEGLSLGRIVRVNRGLYLLAREDEFLEAGVSGAYKYRAAAASDFPAAGETTEEQVIASNIDVIFLVFAINGGRNFTAAGLERYLTTALNSGARPVVILNKADLCPAEQREKALLTAEASAPGCGIYMVSAETGEGLAKLGGGTQPPTGSCSGFLRGCC